jgi:cell division protein FtsW (lipid II flippase)
MQATIRYTLMRLVLFAAVFVLLYVAGARSLLLLGLAVLISGVLSYFLLMSQRTAMSDAISRRVTGFRQRLEAGARAEDDE